jgi:hypothetical protein
LTAGLRSQEGTDSPLAGQRGTDIQLQLSDETASPGEV